MDTEQHIEVNHVYKVMGFERWGSKFKVRKINSMAIVCGTFLTYDGKPRQNACFKMEEFIKILK